MPFLLLHSSCSFDKLPENIRENSSMPIIVDLGSGVHSQPDLHFSPAPVPASDRLFQRGRGIEIPFLSIPGVEFPECVKRLWPMLLFAHIVK